MISDFSIKFRINEFHIKELNKLHSGIELDNDPFIDGFFELKIGNYKSGYILDKNIPSDVIGSDNILNWFELMIKSYQLLKDNNSVFMNIPESYNQYIKYEWSSDSIKITILTSENKKIQNSVDIKNFGEKSVEQQTITINKNEFYEILKIAYIHFKDTILANNNLLNDSKILNTCSEILGIDTRSR